MVNFPNEIIPVVILAGGQATRLQPLSDEYPKSLVPIAGKPLIGRILDGFRQEGFINFILVHPPESDKLNTYIMKLMEKHPNLKISHIEQNEPKGMVHAVHCAEKQIKETLSQFSPQFQECNVTPFFILTAVDVVLDQPDLVQFIESHIGLNPTASLALYKSEDVKMSETHGNVKLDGHTVVDMIEKPGPNNNIDDYYSIPIYSFTAKLLEYLDKVEKSSRNEFELPTAIKFMLSDGLFVHGLQLCKKRKITSNIAGKYHMTYIQDVLKMTFRFLIEEPFNYTGEYPTLIEPVSAKSCIIGDSVLVGPNVYIGEDCDIGDYTEISQCILMGHNKIGNNVQIENAIIGTNVVIPDDSIIKDTLVMENNEHHQL